jgi:hypothetical protein
MCTRVQIRRTREQWVTPVAELEAALKEIDDVPADLGEDDA